MQYCNIKSRTDTQVGNVKNEAHFCFLTRLRLVDGEITAHGPRDYGSCFLTKQCIFCYSSFFYLFIFTFSAKRVFLSKLFCIFALEHRLIVLMGQESCMLFICFHGFSGSPPV